MERRVWNPALLEGIVLGASLGAIGAIALLRRWRPAIRLAPSHSARGSVHDEAENALVERAQHAVELVAHLHDQPGRRHHAVGAVPAAPELIADACCRNPGSRPRPPGRFLTALAPRATGSRATAISSGFAGMAPTAPMARSASSA